MKYKSKSIEEYIIAGDKKLHQDDITGAIVEYTKAINIDVQLVILYRYLINYQTANKFNLKT